MAITVVATPAQLSWSDFRVVDALPDGSGDEAQTATQMPAMEGVQVVSHHGMYSLPDLTLRVGLNRSETMVIKSASKTSDLLKHEQGHFDITILAVRALAVELQRLKAHSAASLAQQVKAAIQKHQGFADAIEEKYDSETNNSKNKNAQKDWNKAIAGALGASGVLSLQDMPL
ncbi:MAG: DUF922 domain-containing protein [Bryobacteraceae bacterium]